MSVSEYEKKFLELVRLVPYIQADEVLKCKRFLSGLQHRIRVHLSVVPQNRFGDLVEAALRVEQSTTTMYQSRQESKGVHQALPNRALDSTAKRETRVEVIEAEVQVEELSLAKDLFDHKQPQEVVDLQNYIFHCALHVRGGILESVG